MSQFQSPDPSNSIEVNSEEAAQSGSGETHSDLNSLVFEASTLDGNSVIDLSMLNSVEPSQSLDSYFGNSVFDESPVESGKPENIEAVSQVDMVESAENCNAPEPIVDVVTEAQPEEIHEQVPDSAAAISFESASPIGDEDSQSGSFEPEVDLDDLFSSDESEEIESNKTVANHSAKRNAVVETELVTEKQDASILVAPEEAKAKQIDAPLAISIDQPEASIVKPEASATEITDSQPARNTSSTQLEVIKVSGAKKVKSKVRTEKKAEESPKVESKAKPADPEVSEIDALIAIADNDFPAVEEDVAEENGFANLGLSKKLVAALDKSGYKIPTPIQAQTIPSLLAGRDVLGQAQTGTGKTAAFALPILDRIDTKQKRPQVLVLAPTRELAIQVAESFEKYASCIGGLRVAAIYGGQDYQIQINKLQRGAQVIVGTPGRVLDHMRRKTLQLGKLDALVLDEADEMLRMGFAEDVDAVLEAMPEKRQMALFSATMPPKIREIAQTHLKDPVEVTIQKKTTTAETIVQRYIVASPHQKKAALVRIMEAEPVDGAIVFVKMRSTTEPLANELANHGFKTAALNGDIPQKQREKIIESLKNGKIDIIIATDVAARGLDVQRISHVINYDLPHDDEAYVHRIGRTGRAGREGNAILFLHPRERYVLTQLEKATRKKIDVMELPSNRDINKQRVSRFHEMITKALGHKDLSKFVSLIQQYQTDTDVPLEKIAAALGIIANAGKPLFQNDELKLSGFSEGHRNDRGRNDRGRNSRGRNDTFRTSAERQERKNSRSFSGKTTTYRLDVGRQHGVQVGNIVGAIANEAGIDNSAIGKIKIFDRFTSIDLPQTMGGDAIEHLKKVVVKGRPLNIAEMQNSESKDSPRPASRSGYGGGYQGGGNGGGSGKRPFKKPFKKTSYESKPRGRNNS